MSNMSEAQKILNFIAGEFKEPFAGRWFPRESPITGEVHAEVPDSELLDLVQAVQGANKAWAAWQKSEAAGRAEILLKIGDLIAARAEPLANLQATDTGCPMSHARSLVNRSARAFHWHAEQLHAPVPGPVVPGYSPYRLPIGLVGVLTPWSDSFLSLSERLAPALAAGNVVIAKPSELAPLTANALAELVAEAGLPPGVFNLVQGRGETVGAALVEHPGVSTIAFAGRAETGRRVQVAAAEQLKRTHLVLGARNPVLVFADCDLAKEIDRLVGIACNSSPAVRGSRIFVQDTIYQSFLELFKEALGRLSIGDPRDEKTALGPMVSQEEKNRYLRAVAQATGEKGKLLLGDGAFANLEYHGEATSHGSFIRPAAVYDLTLCSTLQQDEVIGPFMSLASFKYQHEAIKHANNSPLGQVAYVFHADSEKAARIAAKIEAGRVFVNSGPVFEDHVEFGGVKRSALGREGGSALFRFFSRETLVRHV